MSLKIFGSPVSGVNTLLAHLRESTIVFDSMRGNGKAVPYRLYGDVIFPLSLTKLRRGLVVHILGLMFLVGGLCKDVIVRSAILKNPSFDTIALFIDRIAEPLRLASFSTLVQHDYHLCQVCYDESLCQTSHNTHATRIFVPNQCCNREIDPLGVKAMTIQNRTTFA